MQGYVGYKACDMYYTECVIDQKINSVERKEWNRKLIIVIMVRFLTTLSMEYFKLAWDCYQFTKHVPLSTNKS